MYPKDDTLLRQEMDKILAQPHRKRNIKRAKEFLKRHHTKIEVTSE